MPLRLVTTSCELIASPCVVRALREALAADGRATLLVPSFAQALDAQRALAAAGGLSLGVTVTTPSAWASERWEVWGDGRRVVDAAARRVLCERVLTRSAGRAGARVTNAPGSVALLADLARSGLPWMLAARDVPSGVTAAEADLVALLGEYERELDARGLVEECSVMAGLPGVLDAAGAREAAVVLAGFSTLRRAERELVSGLAGGHEVTLVAHVGEGPEFDQARRMLRALDGAPPRLVPEGGDGARPLPVGREEELEAVLGALFAAGADVVAPTGAVRLLLPAGPSAEPELVARAARELADDGCRDVAVVAPDPARAWRDLAPRLAARGISARAQLQVPVAGLEAGRAFLELAETVALLAGLLDGWPEPVPVRGAVRVGLADMSWWPPRALSDFLLSDISHVGASRARRLDAEWRANRLLTPGVLLEQLQSERATSPEAAAAVRELLRGRLGSAASKLLGPYVRGEGVGSPAAPEAEAALSAVLAVAKTLKELGVSADQDAPGAIPLSELVRIARTALEGTPCTLRPEVAAGAVPGEGSDAPSAARPACVVSIMGASQAARLAPCSVDAVVLLGQTSTESPIAPPDDVCSALLAAYGVEPLPSTMEAARARFASVLRAARRGVVAERLLFGADGKAAYPSVMLTELLACYGAEADARPEEIAAVLGEARVLLRSETPVRENVSSSGAAASVAGSEDVAPAGVISEGMGAFVQPPSEGALVEGDVPVLSASQIESYLECPYKWFSLRRLRLRDADAGFTGAEVGTFAHRVLEVTRKVLLACALERAEGGDALARAYAEDPEGMQSEAFAAEVDALLARAQADPLARVEGSSVALPEALEEARSILSEEFEAHLSHQYQLVRGRRPLPQALVPHGVRDHGALAGLRRDLVSLLDYERGLLAGYEPRFFEWGFGRGGDEVPYAGVRLTGTVDRIDVDAHGQAVVIDYKHKSSTGFAAEYDVFPQGGHLSATVPPRRVQSLIYGQVVRRAFPGLTVRAAVYLCTKGDHALAGAVDEGALDNVFGERGVSSRRLERIAVPRSAGFGASAGTSGLEGLLDACEEAIAARIERMLAGDIEARPLDAEACNFCPVLNCERRISK